MAKKDLSSMWGLTAPQKGPSDTQAALFRKDFATGIREFSARVDSAMRYATSAQYDILWRKRNLLFGEYQKVAKTIDPADPSKAEDAIETFLGELDDLNQLAKDVDELAEKNFKAWEKSPALNYELQGKLIDGLDTEGYADVQKLVDLKTPIDDLIEAHDWPGATAAVAALETSVDAAVTEHEAAKAAAAAAAPDPAADPAADPGADPGDDDDEDLIIFDLDRKERKAKRKYEKLFRKLDKGAQRIVALADISEELSELQTSVREKHEEAEAQANNGDYSDALETAKALKTAILEFKEPYKAWGKAKKRCDALLPKVTDGLFDAQAIEPFNREMQTELAHLAEIEALYPPLLTAFDFIGAELILADLVKRIKYLEKRDDELADERRAMAALVAIAPRMHAVLGDPATAVLADAQNTVRETRDRLETAMLGEIFENAQKELVTIEKEIIAYEEAKAAFDGVIADTRSALDAADSDARAAVARELIGGLSKAELSSLPGDLRDDLTQAVKSDGAGEGEDGAATAMAESEPVLVVEDDDGCGGRLDQAEKQLRDFHKIPRKKRKFIKRILDEAAGILPQVKKAVDAGDSAKADTLLNQVEELWEEARASLDLLSGYPDPDKLDAVLDNAGGADAFDDIVKSLPKGVPQRAFEVAIEKRFGMEVTLEDAAGDPEQLYDKSDRSLKKIYEMLELVPEHHVIDNDQLSEIVRRSELDDGGLWDVQDGDETKGYIELECGRPSRRDLEEGFANPRAEKIDDDCKRKPGAKKPTFFDFTTLHEIGHAVDEKNKFMNSKMSKPAYGGWVDHKGDCGTIAEIGARKFGYDRDHMELWLQKEDLPYEDYPEAPSDDEKAQKEWRDARVQAYKWCEAIRMKNEDDGLFDSGKSAHKWAIDGRVYQESYPGQWVSYDLSARRQAITGYQFRAPGEWFAEIYAAYYSGQLKDSHPSAGWLKQLETPEGTAAAVAA